MSTRRTLVVYGTSHGQTAKVARRIADVLTELGDAVTVADVDELPRGLSPRDFDAAVVGSPILYGHHRRSVGRFVRAHRDALNAMPSAFFSVSGSAGSPHESEREQARRCVDAFLRETGWHPGHIETIGGAMAYTKYGPIMRWMTRRAAQRAGGPTDTTRDHEYTDWAQVRRFAESLAAARPQAEPARETATV